MLHLVFTGALALTSSLTLAVSDPEDTEGTHDHPDIPRFPGYIIGSMEENDFNAISMLVKWDKTSNNEEAKDLEGRYFKVVYGIKGGAKRASPVQLTRNYENAAKKLGATILTSGATTYDGKLTFKVSKGGGTRWVHVNVYNSGDGYEVTVLDEAAMAQEIELSAASMLDALQTNGFVALRGILFDTGKDTIKPESEALLAEIVKLLNENASLSVSVEGHTDNVGDPKANRALSEKRAKSVKAYLVGKGIAAKRLGAAGFGDTRPIADNRLEDGRAQNRRVELVKTGK